MTPAHATAGPRSVVAVDVGTGSARAAVFGADGRRLSLSESPIQIWRPAPDHVEQSSEGIWGAVCSAVRAAVTESGCGPGGVAGISFDATCSLVAIDAGGGPLSVSTTGAPEQNVVVWMDHRASAIADELNTLESPVLRYVGGRLSPEMEIPKLAWIKRNLPDTWQRAAHFFDLADYLTWRASGSDARSTCTMVCKWTYMAHDGGSWDTRFLANAGLDDLIPRGLAGAQVLPMATRVGNLTPSAADGLGLTTGCSVGLGIIDAHAGGLGLLGATWSGNNDGTPARLESGLALIGGTSSCHMAVSAAPRFIDGVWGPYFGAMVPGMWLTEGGQSSAGSAIDRVIRSHQNSAGLLENAAAEGETTYAILNRVLDTESRARGLPDPGLLTQHTHVVADFNGNRSPLADQRMHGAMEGLSEDPGALSHAIEYCATIQAVAYGTRHIVEVLNASGYSISRIYATGGGTRNALWLQTHADALGADLVLSGESEAVLLGTAILAAVGAGLHPHITDAMRSMAKAGSVVKPNPRMRAFHDAKYQIFREMQTAQRAHRRTMDALGMES